MPIDLEKLEAFTYVPPGPLSQATMDRHPRAARFFPMGKLLKGLMGECAWCNTGLVPGNVRKYCTADCRESALMHCNPQGPGAKAWFFINRQACTCVGCGEIYEDEWAAKVERQWEILKDRVAQGWVKNLSRVPYHWIGDGMGVSLHLDHVVPLCQGGQGIGFTNVQVLCVLCHDRKTVAEHSARLKAHFRAHRESKGSL